MSPPELRRKSPCRSSSSLRVLRRQSLPRRRPGALRNTSVAKRQAAKLCYRFGPLTPSARSANLIAGDGTKNGLSRSEQKTVSATQNNRLTGKAPYKSAHFRSLTKAHADRSRARASPHLDKGVGPRV